MLNRLDIKYCHDVLPQLTKTLPAIVAYSPPCHTMHLQAGSSLPPELARRVCNELAMHAAMT